MGEGVEQDDAAAAKWMLKAAEQGYAPAQSNLGVIYSTGSGFRKNPEEAVKWLRKAARQNLAEAQFFLALCYGKGEGVRKDTVEAYAWTSLAARSVQAAVRIRGNLERELSSEQLTLGRQRAAELREELLAPVNNDELP